MINMGTQKLCFLKDGWSVLTQDSKPSAHFEHTITIMKSGPEVLSSFFFIEEELIKIGKKYCKVWLNNHL